jgi:hypothetical protein
MLSKLFKYEIKATARIFLPLFLALWVFAGINKLISLVFPGELAAPKAISMFLYVSIMVGLFVMTIIMMIQRFYKNLLGDEGYLMSTLPTKPWQNIVSKLLISMMWMASSGIAAIISIIIISFNKVVYAKLLQDLAAAVKQIFGLIGASTYLLAIEIIIIFIMGMASSILIIYASIAIGHLFNKHRVLAALGAFLALNTVTQILFVLLSLFPNIADFNNLHVSSNDWSVLQPVIHGVMWYVIACAVLLSAGYFAITNIILSKRLNLE